MGDSAADAFGLFVSSVEGRPASRFGTKILIGAERDPENPRKIKYRTKDIVAIPKADADRYAREYARLVADGDLTLHTADEWQQQTQQRHEAGAPRDKLKTGREPDQPSAKDAHHHADHEGSR